MALKRAVYREAFVVAACVVACGRPDVARDSTLARDTGTPTIAPTVTGEWPAELGAVLVVPSGTDNLAVVLYPVAPGSNGLPLDSVTLTSPGGDVVRRVGLNLTDSLDCGDARIASLARPTPPTWTIGIRSATATTLRTDSMEALAATDSASYGAEMARLASAVSAQHASRFTGLPFTVATLRRFRVDGREVVVSQLVRRISQEADPLEERTLVVAERGAAGGRFVTVHSGHSQGSEDNTDHFDLLAALHTPRGVMVVIAREKSTGTIFDILGRDATGAWTVKWSRSIAC